MILESIVTTTNVDGSPNISPMGPRIQQPAASDKPATLPRSAQTDPAFTRFELRPFDTSTTFTNLKRHRQGVLHIDDNVELFARAAVSKIQTTDLPTLSKAEKIDGHIIQSACRAYEFKVESIDESGPRMSLICEIVKAHRLRDFFGFNRAKHAVIEAAILATRIDFLPAEEIQEQFQGLRVIIEKTAGPAEANAFDYLDQFVCLKLRK